MKEQSTEQEQEQGNSGWLAVTAGRLIGRERAQWRGGVERTARASRLSPGCPPLLLKHPSSDALPPFPSQQPAPAAGRTPPTYTMAGA